MLPGSAESISSKISSSYTVCLTKWATFAMSCSNPTSWSMQINSISRSPFQQWCHSRGMCSLQGIDVIWESVGGDMFRTCTKALGQGGRLIVIGMMSQYADGWGASEVTTTVTCFSMCAA